MTDLLEATRAALALLLSADRALWETVAISFSVSARAILIAAPPALAFAALLAVARFPGRRALIACARTLMATPTVVVGLTVYLLLSRNGPFGDLRLLFTQTAMIVGQILLALPILIAMGHAALRAVDPAAWETARTLGAGRMRAALTLMHEARFGLLAALLAAFSRIVAEVGSAMMVGGNILHYTRNIPTAIALETSKGEFAQGIALGLVLLLLALTLNGLLTLLQTAREGEASVRARY